MSELSLNSINNGKANLNHTHVATDITNLPTVAKTGDYNDLINKPVTSGGSGTRGFVFITTNGTFTVPTGLPTDANGKATLLISLVGGGSGAWGAMGNYSTGGNGQNGDVILLRPVLLVPGTVVNVTIGAGGSGGPVWNNPGGNGGATSFGNYLTANGGTTGYSATTPLGAIPGGVTSNDNGYYLTYAGESIWLGKIGNGMYGTGGTGVYQSSGNLGKPGCCLIMY